MWEPRGMFGLIVSFVVLQLVSAAQEIKNVSPNKCSLAGGTRITVEGVGFSKDKFSYDDPTKGNSITLVSEDGDSLDADIHLDGCTEVQLMGYIKSGMKEGIEYTIRVKVDNVAIPTAALCPSDPNKCIVTCTADYTPTVDTISPTAGIPGTFLITMTGKLFTDKYGSGIATGTNGKKEAITRVWSPQACQLKDGDNFYHLALLSESSDDGKMICKPDGTFIGNTNVTFMVQGPYGTSLTNKLLLWMSTNGQLAMLQYYTSITGLSHTTGSVEGGLTVIATVPFIMDSGPKSTYKKTIVKVGGVDCSDVTVTTDVDVSCTVPAKPADKTHYAGGRGVNLDYWDSPPADLAAILAATTPSGSLVLAAASFLAADYSTKSTRMSTMISVKNKGEYALSCEATNGCAVYLGDVLQATSEGAMATGPRVTLEANTEYLVRVVAKHGSDPDAGVDAILLWYDTWYTHKHTTLSIPEIQRIQATSTETFDEFSMAVAGATASTAVNEVQKVCLGSTGDPMSVQMGFYGVYTEPCNFESVTEMATCLNKLPFLDSTTSEAFTVVANAQDPTCRDVTFVSKRGDIPPMTVDTNHALTSTEVTQGVADNQYLSFMFDGRPSPLFMYDASDTAAMATTMQTSLNKMMGTQCPSRFFDSTLFDFEEGTLGAAVSDVPAFCGSYSLKNYKYVYPVQGQDREDFSLAIKSWLCFAVKGLVEPNIYITYRTPSGTTKWNRQFTLPLLSVSESEGGWSFTCINVLKLVKDQNPNEASNAFKLRYAWLDNAGSDFWTDTVSHTSRDLISGLLKINNMRIGSQYLNNESTRPFTMKSINVAYNSVTSNYDVVLTPNDCGYDLELITLSNSEVTSGDKAAASNSVVSALTGGTATPASLTVNRSQKSSKPITGTASITYGGKTASLDVSYTDEEIKRFLETSFSSIGTLLVERTAASTCANMDIDITFDDKPGDNSPMTAGDLNLSPGSADLTITERVDGYQKLPLGYDLVMTPHSDPQVQVYVNDVLSQCPGDCTFTWSTAATPTHTGLNPTTGSRGSTLTALGTMFSTTLEDNTVTIGGVVCVVTAATTTEITCTVGSGTLGTFPVVVTVAGLGKASGDYTFTLGSDIGSVNPLEGSLGGGLTLTFAGEGFSNLSEVKVGDNVCPQTGTTTPTTLTCVLPAYSVLTATTDQTETIVMSRDGVTMTTTFTFTYKVHQTATINTLTGTADLRVLGGQEITATGSDFTDTATMFIGATALTTVSNDGSTLVATTPRSLSPGLNQPLGLLVAGQGFALKNNAIPLVDVPLTLDNVAPLIGSMHGGTPVTFTGEGFGTNADDIEAFVGEHAIDIASVTDTQIVGNVRSTSKIHPVNNMGSKDYYSFNPPYLEIEVGDSVQWTWEHPSFVDSKASIRETDSAISNTAKTGGFDSGSPVSKGEFMQEFNQVNEYGVNISSGFVDSNNLISYRMIIKILERLPSLGEITLKIADQEVPYNIGSGVADPVDSRCDVATAISGCVRVVPASLSTADASKFNFEFANCYTPTVSGMSFTAASAIAGSATSNTEVDLTGTGLWNEVCAVHAYVDGCEATVSPSPTTTSLTFTPKESCQPTVGELKPVSVKIYPFGYALMEPKDRYLAFLPLIDEYLPKKGSTQGGDVVTVTGSGLKGVTSVTFAGVAATCEEPTDSEIVCTTPLSQSGPIVVSVGTFTGVCGLSNCDFSYDATITSTVTAVTPDTVSGQTTLAFAGTMLGTDPTALTIMVGGETCGNINLISDTSVECDVAAIPAGTNRVTMAISGKGNADVASSVTVAGGAVITSPTPSEGSIHGMTELLFPGHGFSDVTTVKVGDVDICTEVTTTLTSLSCTTVAHVAGSVDVAVVSNGQTYATVAYEFAESATPSVLSVDKTSGVEGDTMTITGEKLSATAADVSVYVGDTECDVQTPTTLESVSCILGASISGSMAVMVNVTGKGQSNDDVLFTYLLAINSISPDSGDERGGQLLTATGSGLSAAVGVTVCGVACPVSSWTATEVVCLTPAKGTTSPCDVIVSDADGDDGTTITAGTQYTYTAGSAPTIMAMSPSQGGTGGGTTLTLDISGVSGGTVFSVTIAGVECVIQSSTDTQITCLTGAHSGSTVAAVKLVVDNRLAFANEGVSIDYSYADSWSNLATWDNVALPGEGELIVISEGQHIVLDMDTPELAMLLIDGGSLVFAEQDVELNAERILIMNGGSLKIGSKEKPFTNKAVITLHGHHRSPELPIYGTKCLAVRNGTLDLYGSPIAHTWTKLASSVEAGATSITVEDNISDWGEGDEIVIATTGGHESQGETETAIILSRSGNTLTLVAPLTNSHSAITEEYDGPNSSTATVEYRAEVGLLTRTILVQGKGNAQWNDVIEACPDGFNTGEFATQTCFQGRFGEEIGSDEFGAQIIIHQPTSAAWNTPDEQIARAHLEYVELNYMGQAFRLGRYPVHFHLQGHSDKSSVKGCSIHKTFNRAINIHNTHGLTVEDNVVYDVMGGALFLEDGIETGNIFIHNLALFVKASSSLLNDDITPAAFWATNPNNTYIDNTAAGGSHFGWWYRMLEHPEGPSHTTDVCPRRVPLGEFTGNTAHSNGWFGIWIFQDYYPVEGGDCSGNADPVPAKFNNFSSWNNEKGAEAVNSGAIQFWGGVYANNQKAGIEFKMLVNNPRHDSSQPSGSGVYGSTIIGKATSSDLELAEGITDSGLIIPWGNGFVVRDTRFNAFQSATTQAIRWTIMDGTCGFKCVAGYSHFKGLEFANDVTNKFWARWEHEFVFYDEDGSVCGNGESWYMPEVESFLPSTCNLACVGHRADSYPVRGCATNEKAFRIAIGNALPSSLEGKRLIVNIPSGNEKLTYQTHRVDIKGWAAYLLGNTVNFIEFENAEAVTNISFQGVITNLGYGDKFMMGFKTSQEPDKVWLDKSVTGMEKSAEAFDFTTEGKVNGDWYFDSTNNHVNILVKGPDTVNTVRDQWLNLQILRCFYANCIPPLDPESDEPLSKRPSLWFNWTDTSIWSISSSSGSTGAVVKTTEVIDTGALPVANEDVIISNANGGANWVVITNYNPPKLGTVKVYGGLEIDFETNFDYTFEANFIVVVGGRFVAGWSNNPIIGTINLKLLGHKSSPPLTEYGGFEVGVKAIACFGGCDFHGASKGPAWVELSATAAVGATTLHIASDYDISLWAANDDVVLASTSTNPLEREEMTIASVDAANNQITLKTGLSYQHSVYSQTVGADTIPFPGVVGLRSRSITIEGEFSSSEIDFGGRILVSVTMDDGNARTGYFNATYTRFKHMGQSGFTDSYDPRYALAWVATGDVSVIKPSGLLGNCFDTSPNSAIGVFGAGGLQIANNFVYDFVGDGIVTDSANTALLKNLVYHGRSTAIYDGRLEFQNFRDEAGINAIGSTGARLNGNWVGGCERFGYHVPGEECTTTTADSKYLATDFKDYNYAVGNLYGIMTGPHDNLAVVAGQTCALWSGFIAFNNYDFGMYLNNAMEPAIRNNVFAMNQVSVFTQVIGPSSLSHEIKDQLTEVKDNIFIAVPTGYDCSKETSPSSQLFVTFSRGTYASFAGPNGAMIGLTLGTFTGGGNNCAEKPCNGIMSYPSLGGSTSVSGNAFVNFGPHATCKDSYAIAPSPKNDDYTHPTIMWDSTLQDSHELYKYHNPKPNLGKVNPSDCVDMDCDGLKKVSIFDQDATFFSVTERRRRRSTTSISIFSMSEYMWDGTVTGHGVGDYRIPTGMLTDLDGNRIDPNTLAPNCRGISRSKTCEKVTHAGFSYYKCRDSHYVTVVMESMDKDTELRRLSPIAILNNECIDLLNGPQDHGWCAGYTCQKRVSTFEFMTQSGNETEVHLTSTQPDSVRFFFLSPQSTDCVVIVFPYLNPNRIDTFIDATGSTYQLPTNGKMENGKFVLMNDPGVNYVPTCADPHGTNYIDRDSRRLYIVMKGGRADFSMINLKRSPQLVVSVYLPSMTTDEFFASNIITNLANLLNIDYTKVRLVKIVAANSKRRKRDTGNIVATLEIGEQPTETLESTSTDQPITEADTIVTSCQTGQISAILGVETVCQEVVVDETAYTPIQPNDLRFSVTHESEHEGVPLRTQPQIRAYDTNGAVIADLGINENPWQITATLRSGTGHASATLEGTTVISAASGVFVFTDLAISHAGDGYIIDFEITSPTNTNLTLATAVFSVTGVPMTAALFSQTSGKIEQSSIFTMTLELQDSTTNVAIPDITWRGHVFDTTCGLNIIMDTGTLAGNVTKRFTSGNGQAEFDDLMFTGNGVIYIVCRTQSTPAEFDFYSYHQFFIYTSDQMTVVIEKTETVKVRYDVDFDTVVATEGAKAELMTNTLQQINSLLNEKNLQLIIVKDAQIERGSIIITFTVEGGTANVSAALTSICQNIASGSTFTWQGTDLKLDGYMLVDGEDYYAGCGSGDDGNGLHPAFIALIVVLSVLFVAAIVFGLIWFFKIRPNKKTHDSMGSSETTPNPYSGGFYYIDNGRTVYLGGPNQKVKDIFYKQKAGGLRPESAAPVNTLYDDKTTYTNIRKSPVPDPEALYTDRTLTPI